MATAQAKRLQLLHLLAQGVATLHFDGRAEGVRVPRELRGSDSLALHLSYAFPRMQDLIVDTAQIGVTTTYDGEPYRFVVPWSAVFGVTSPERQGEVWLEDVPIEARLRLGEATQHALEARLPKRHRARMVN